MATTGSALQERPGSTNDGEGKGLNIGDIHAGWAYVGQNGDQPVFAKGFGVDDWAAAMKWAADQEAHMGDDAELDLLWKALRKAPTLKDFFNFSGLAFENCVWGRGSSPYAPTASARMLNPDSGAKFWASKREEASGVMFRTEP